MSGGSTTQEPELELGQWRDRLGVHTVERMIGGRPLLIGSGRMAKQADGAVTVASGGTIVLVAVQAASPTRELDFFPLTVEYREKTSAAGKIPGGFIKREGRPTQKEILTSRAIDRSIRPRFPDHYKSEVQVIATVLSADKDQDPDVLAVIGAAAALHIARIPFHGPIAAVRVGMQDGRYELNPPISAVETGSLDLLVAGGTDGVSMVEAGARELSEEEMVGAIEFGHQAIVQVCDMIEELRNLCGVAKDVVVEPEADTAIRSTVHKRYRDDVREALTTRGKLTRRDAVKRLRERITTEVLARLEPGSDERAQGEKQVRQAFADLEVEVERRMIIDEGRRTDSRSLRDVRPISGDVGLLPRAHGSALFTRGETQAVVTVTLGTATDVQRVEGLRDEYTKRFMLDYNFPPYSVGEVKPIRGPGRREIGHGALAERALQAVLPPEDQFPYTLRVVSDILESNGSSSMATVCGGSLCLMDAGVPLQKPVAGIAMGLVKEGDVVQVLSDIQGSEDHNGDMDFKVAGTRDGITALQMDIKVAGLTVDIMRRALSQAREGLEVILDRMLDIIERPRPEISRHAPKLLRTVIPVEKIGALIGPGGRTIKAIQESTETHIEVEDDGTVLVSGASADLVEQAMRLVEGYTSEAEVGRVYEGKVISIKEFGAFVEIGPGQEGLCHVSELSVGFVKRVEDVVKVGERMRVKVINIDPSGRIKLSRKQVERESGAAEPAAEDAVPAPIEVSEREELAPEPRATETRPSEPASDDRRRGGRGGRSRRPERSEVREPREPRVEARELTERSEVREPRELEEEAPRAPAPPEPTWEMEDLAERPARAPRGGGRGPRRSEPVQRFDEPEREPERGPEREPETAPPPRERGRGGRGGRSARPEPTEREPERFGRGQREAEPERGRYDRDDRRDLSWMDRDRRDRGRTERDGETREAPRGRGTGRDTRDARSEFTQSEERNSRFDSGRGRPPTDDRGQRGRGDRDRLWSSEAPQRDERAPRGGERAPRGGERAPRGDERAPRSDERAPRSDERAPRGRGTERSDSGADRAGPSRHGGGGRGGDVQDREWLDRGDVERFNRRDHDDRFQWFDQNDRDDSADRSPGSDRPRGGDQGGGGARDSSGSRGGGRRRRRR